MKAKQLFYLLAVCLCFDGLSTQAQQTDNSISPLAQLVAEARANVMNVKTFSPFAQAGLNARRSVID